MDGEREADEAVERWLRECSCDARAAWIGLRTEDRERAWSRGARVPLRVARTHARERATHWSDPSGRCELLVSARSPLTLPAFEVERWGRVALALVEKETRATAADAPPAARRLHDLAQLLAHAELELAVDADGAVARARSALHDARALLSETRTPGAPAADSPGPVDVGALLEREARRAHASRAASDVTVRVRAREATNCVLRVEPFERLARNLIVNALQASPRGSTVEIEAVRAGDTLELVVRDAGRGLESRAAERLFTHGATRPRGSGIGAQSVRACALELDAEVRVQSRCTVGTEIRVRMPAVSSSANVWLVDPLGPRRAHRARTVAQPGETPRLAAACDELASRGPLRAAARVVLARGAPVRGLAAALARSGGSAPSVEVLGWSDAPG